MAKLTEELWSYLKPGSGSEFDRSFSPSLFSIPEEVRSSLDRNLERFLFATMDEIRLRYAAESAKRILSLANLEDADHFRQGVLRREVTGDVTYIRQRDHSAHTLYNYVLGWYIFSKNSIIKNNLLEHFERRGVEPNFRDAWPFASLLHDVGYIFEGSLQVLSTETQVRQISLGAEIADDYFRHRFWTECGVDSIADRKIVLSQPNLEPPSFSDRSIAGVADSLRSLGDLEELRKAVEKERWNNKRTGANVSPRKEIDCISEEYGLPGDAFDLWKKHYRYFRLDTMVERVQLMRGLFEDLTREGLGGTGLRLLDHGICSGLLVLLYSTYWFRVFFGFRDGKLRNRHEERVRDLFKQSAGITVTQAYWWWAVVVWATAAAALHNIQQDKSIRKMNLQIKPIRVEEDPLAYLGVLVDCIQEWDRYTVSGEPVIAGLLPLQGADVDLKTERGKIVIDYRDEERAASVRDALGRSLQGWANIVEILPAAAD